MNPRCPDHRLHASRIFLLASLQLLKAQAWPEDDQSIPSPSIARDDGQERVGYRHHHNSSMAGDKSHGQEAALRYFSARREECPVAGQLWPPEALPRTPWLEIETNNSEASYTSGRDLLRNRKPAHKKLVQSQI